MTHGFSLSPSDYPFEKYFIDYSISNVTKDKLNETDILILPSPYQNSKYYFAQDAYSGESGRQNRRHPDSKPALSGHPVNWVNCTTLV